MTSLGTLILDPIKQVKFVEKPKYLCKTLYIDVPYVKYIEKKYIDLHENYIYKNYYLKKIVYVEKVKHIPKVITQEKVIEVPQIVYKNKYLDKPIYVIKDKIIHKPVNLIIERVIPVLKKKKKNEIKYIDEMEIKNLFLENKDFKDLVNSNNYNNNVFRASNILEILVKKIFCKNYKVFFTYLESYSKCHKNVLDNNISYNNLSNNSFLKDKNKENFLNIKHEIEECERYDIFFNDEINKFINCIREENKSNLHYSCKGKIEYEDMPYIKNMKELRKERNIDNYQINNNLLKGNENKVQIVSKNEEKKNFESPIVIPNKDYTIRKNKEIHLLEGKLYKNYIFNSIFPDLNKFKNKNRFNEIIISEVYKNSTMRNQEHLKHSYKKNYQNLNFEIFNNEENNNLNIKKNGNKEDIYKYKRTLRNSTIMQNFAIKKKEYNSINNTLEACNKIKNANEKLHKKNSNDSDIIIDNFIKNLGNDKLLYGYYNKENENIRAQKKNKNEISCKDSVFGSNYYKQHDLKNTINNRVETSRNKKNIRNCYKSNELLECEKNINEHENILILLYKIINEFIFCYNYKKNEKNDKILYKVNKIINKYKKLFANHRYDVEKLNYYLKKNEVILLKDILIYIIEVMKKIKYEYKGMEKQIEKQIYELEETICNRPT